MKKIYLVLMILLLSAMWYIGLSQSISWTCTDPDSDEVFCDVRFGTDSSALPLLYHDLTAVSDSTFIFYVGPLEENTIYYWRIDANDYKTYDDGTPHETVIGKRWWFSTVGIPPDLLDANIIIHPNF